MSFFCCYIVFQIIVIREVMCEEGIYVAFRLKRSYADQNSYDDRDIYIYMYTYISLVLLFRARGVKFIKFDFFLFGLEIISKRCFSQGE